MFEKSSIFVSIIVLRVYAYSLLWNLINNERLAISCSKLYSWSEGIIMSANSYMVGSSEFL